jgi:S-adenosylmethionine:tRNA ribosyltransferase-isomerase
VRVSDFDYHLPEDLVAQAPRERGTSRLMVLRRDTGAVTSTHIAELPSFLRAGDVLVANDTRVFPARLLGHRVPSGGAVECLLLGRVGQIAGADTPAYAPSRDDRWEALVHPGQKLKVGARFECERQGRRLFGEIVGRESFGKRTIALTAEHGDVDAAIDAIGHVPLPPYIKRADRIEDVARYQTVFARRRGSVAAPTAGLHFTEALLQHIDAVGVHRVHVTLHVGYGTFKPVRAEFVSDHRVDPEHYEIADDAARAINRALDEGRRVVAVGTTTTRAVEDAALVAGGRVVPGRRDATLFIHPGHRFAVIGGLVTNFHVPRSSLLMLVCAFAGREQVLRAYERAVAERFRFYSYGDAMLVV